MNPKVWWYLARASGLVSWGLLSASVLWGLAVSTRLFGRKPSPAWFLDLHRFLGGLALTFTGVHVLGLVADTSVHFGPAQILVPLASRWHPIAVAWGVIALYLIVAVEGTSLAMRRLPRAGWRAIHRASLALFVFATIHALSAGSDVKGNPVVWWSALTVTLVVLFGWTVRTLSPRGGGSRPVLAPTTKAH